MNKKLVHEVILGVDTHLNKHVGVIIDNAGKFLRHLSIDANPKGYHQLLEWARSFGDVQRAGVEGPGTYGADLAKFLSGQDLLSFSFRN